jgi:hypothetical protein
MSGIIESFIVGLISGGLSSYIVYVITKSREEKAIKARELKDFSQMMSRYLRTLALAIEYSMDKDGSGDIKHIKKELIDPPRLIHNKQSDLKTETQNILRATYVFLGELENDVDINDRILNTRLMKYRSQLIQHAINVLKI